MHRRVILLLLAGLASPASTQIGLPTVGQTIGNATSELQGAADNLTRLDVESNARSIAQLAGDRVVRLTAFVRRHRDSIEYDDRGEPARKGVVLLSNADTESLAIAREIGFAIVAREVFGSLGLSATTLSVPPDTPLDRALSMLRTALPDKEVTADQIYFPAGKTSVRGKEAGAGTTLPPFHTKIGLIDAGVASTIVQGVTAKGFARGAPAPSDHGTAVAYLMRHAGARAILAADVYGNDPAGGNALAIVRALDWLAGEKARVVSISLVGPRNPLLERAVAAATRRGMLLVAAVGNDGPSAPPAYPASYPSVLAITGVDGRNRPLIEAGRTPHLDYAAPAANIRAPDSKGRRKEVRGTSFAAPFVAARAAALAGGHTDREVRTLLDREALDLGKKGPDPSFGRGLLCPKCRPQ